VDATCGRLVPSRDPGALAAALAALAADPGLRQALADTARARVERQFTLDRMVREYRDLYYAAAA
jgi:glycosyltransferase involved in cell wall biosynthesis